MWKQIYEKVLSMCENPIDDELAIVEVEQPNYSVDLIENENANENSLYAFKLDDGATEDDYKMFSEYIYNYVGLDIYDYLPKERNDGKMELEEQKIRELLKRYGAEDEEIENFMQDLGEKKEDLEEDEEEYLLNEDTISKLKETQKGQDLIINAPKMAKEDLKKAIKEYLTK